MDFSGAKSALSFGGNEDIMTFVDIKQSKKQRTPCENLPQTSQSLRSSQSAQFWQMKEGNSKRILERS